MTAWHRKRESEVKDCSVLCLPPIDAHVVTAQKSTAGHVAQREIVALMRNIHTDVKTWCTEDNEWTRYELADRRAAGQ